MENIKMEYSSYYLEATKEIKLAQDALLKNNYVEASEHCLNAQVELRLMNTAVKTWIPTKE